MTDCKFWRSRSPRFLSRPLKYSHKNWPICSKHIYLQHHWIWTLYLYERRRNRTSNIVKNFRSWNTLKYRNGIFMYCKMPFRYFNAHEYTVFLFRFFTIIFGIFMVEIAVSVFYYEKLWGRYQKPVKAASEGSFRNRISTELLSQ